MNNNHRKRFFISFLVICLMCIVAVSCGAGRTRTEDTDAEESIAETVETEEIEDDSSDADAEAEAKAEEEKAAAEAAQAAEEQAAAEAEQKAKLEAEEKAKKEAEAKAKKEAAKKKSEKKSKTEEKKWVEAVYKEVYHPEEGHYETVQKVKCKCGKVFDTAAEHKAHQDAYIQSEREKRNDPSFTCDGSHVSRYITEEVYVVDKAAWTEQVLVSEGHWE